VNFKPRLAVITLNPRICQHVHDLAYRAHAKKLREPCQDTFRIT
jgi:hypothetical protein